jgi:serine/threonine protein kinase
MSTEPVEKASPALLRLGRYDVRAKIADGGMATVFVAHVAQGANASGRIAGDLPDVVAIKMIRDEFARSGEFLTMFMDEAKIVSRLRHPNIVRYHELGNEGGHVFIAMELLFGQSLWTVWDACRTRGMRLRYDMIAWIGARVADGLHYAHEFSDEGGRSLEIVHRDVNATNIFVTYEGDIKIIDFGLAKATNRASKTAAGIIKGKVAYMSPEQAIGAPVDRRTDVFALATTLWELCCDRRLFKRSDEVETLKRVHAAEVPDPTRLQSDFPLPLWRTLEHALARDKERRYATAAEFARDLDAFAREGGSGVDRRTVSAVMGELFAEDRERQAAWIAEASAPEQRAPLGPLKDPSRFWSAEDLEVPSSALPMFAAGGANAVRPSAELRASEAPGLARRSPRWVEVVIAALLAIALIVAIVLSLR